MIWKIGTYFNVSTKPNEIIMNIQYEFHQAKDLRELLLKLGHYNLCYIEQLGQLHQ